MKTLYSLLLCLISIACPAATLLTEIPPLTNPWDVAHLYIVDKDTSGAIANANDRYLQSLQAMGSV